MCAPESIFIVTEYMLAKEEKPHGLERLQLTVDVRGFPSMATRKIKFSERLIYAKI